MADWFKRMTTMISSQEDNTQLVKPTDGTHEFSSLFSRHSLMKRINPVKPVPPVKKSPPAVAIPSNKDDTPKEEEKVMKTPEDNLKALKRLRDLPRGTQVDSRIAAIEDLLGEKEIFITLKMLRWPQGVICPRCRSSNVIKLSPPVDAVDQRHYYECLNCKSSGKPSGFDDFTGLPIQSMHALRQWVLCWYLIGFCSVTQIAKVLGISLQQAIQIATYGNELAEFPEIDSEYSASGDYHSEKQEHARHKRKAQIENQEERTRSKSKDPLKPGYKSKT